MQSTVSEAIQILNNGGVGVLATDTIYGLVARAVDQQAVERLYRVKPRESKTGTIIAASARQLIELGVSRYHVAQVEHLWPNPLSIDLPISESLSYLRKGTNSPAVRVVADEYIKNILLQTGPLMTTSANSTGMPSSTTIEIANGYFGNTVDFYVDHGDLSGRLPSTLISIGGAGTITVLRQSDFMPPLNIYN